MSFCNELIKVKEENKLDNITIEKSSKVLEIYLKKYGFHFENMYLRNNMNAIDFFDFTKSDMRLIKEIPEFLEFIKMNKITTFSGIKSTLPLILENICKPLD